MSALPVVFLAVFVRPNWDTESTGAFIVEATGYFFLLAGLAIRMWCILYIGGKKSLELVTDGPYSLCRNPLYVGTFLLVIGTGLCFENILMLIAVFILIVPIHLLVTRMEEKHLLEIYPDAFPEYVKAVPRFWPRFGNYKSRESVTVTIRAIRRVAFDTIIVLMIPLAEDLLELLHDHGIIPVLLWFPQ